MEVVSRTSAQGIPSGFPRIRTRGGTYIMRGNFFPEQHLDIRTPEERLFFKKQSLFRAQTKFGMNSTNRGVSKGRHSRIIPRAADASNRVRKLKTFWGLRTVRFRRIHPKAWSSKRSGGVGKKLG